MDEPDPAPSRRLVLRSALGVAGVGVLAGCAGTAGPLSAGGASAVTATGSASSASSSAVPSTSVSTTTPSATASTTAPTTGPAPASAPAPTVTPLPVVQPWSPSPSDVQPEVKLAAVRTIEAALTHAADGAGVAAARARVAAIGQDPGLVSSLGDLVTSSGGAVVRVVDAQYGGLLATSASVLVVCRTWAFVAGRVTQGGSTIDVRLSSASPRWRVTALMPSQPGPATTALTAAARAVLASPRITLPPASVADVRSGQVHDSVLSAMLGLAQGFTLGVSVVRSGHPLLVFGTNRRSDHPQGRAFDTWAVDGQAVVSSSTPRSLVTAYMRAAAAAGSYNVGGPVLLSGSTYFSDNTHHDHVHAGFRT